MAGGSRAWADEGGLRAEWMSACVQVFERVARNALSAVMEGINSTLFAYGQTGSGARPACQSGGCGGSFSRGKREIALRGARGAWFRAQEGSRVSTERQPGWCE